MRTGKTVKAKQKQRETDLSKYTDKKDVDHDLQNNYFILAKTSVSKVHSRNVALSNDSEKLHNESSDGDYDHLGENVRQKVEEDTYHHAFFSSNEDESDYGVRNVNDDNLTENPYDHTNTGA